MMERTADKKKLTDKQKRQIAFRRMVEVVLGANVGPAFRAAKAKIKEGYRELEEILGERLAWDCLPFVLDELKLELKLSRQRGKSDPRYLSKGKGREITDQAAEDEKRCAPPQVHRGDR